MTTLNIEKTETKELGNDNFKKINISGMLKKRGKKDNPSFLLEETKEETKKEEIVEEKKSIPKIKLSLGKKKNPIEEKEISPIKEKTDEDKTEKPKKISLSLNKYKIIEEKEEEKNSETNLKGQENLEKKSEDKKEIIPEIEKNKKPEIKQETEKIVEEKITFGDQVLIKDSPESLFNNYHSDFESDGNSIIKKLKKLKNPAKTRMGLVIGGLGITFIISVSAFVFMPKANNLDSYKAEILGNTKTEKVIKAPKNTINTNNDIKNPPKLDNNIKDSPKSQDKKVINNTSNKILDKKKLDKIKNFLIKNRK